MKNLLLFIEILAVVAIGFLAIQRYSSKKPAQQTEQKQERLIESIPSVSDEDIIKELTPELNPDNNPNFGATIDAREDNYVRGGAGFGGGGYGWYAVKQNGKWEIVEKTQNAPSCSIMQKYNFPKSIYQDCRPD